MVTSILTQLASDLHENVISIMIYLNIMICKIM